MFRLSFPIRMKTPDNIDPPGAAAGAPPPEPPAKRAGETAPESASEYSAFTAIFGILFWGCVIVGGLYWQSSTARAFLDQWWMYVLGLVVVFCVLVCLPSIRSGIRSASAEVRTGLIVFLVLPLLLLGIGTVVFLPMDSRLVVLRSVFLVIACLFPALIYYLFIATRKIGLLNDYFINLRRLGLLEPQSSVPSAAARSEQRVRLMNYIQQFEALYGPLPEPLVAKVLDSDDPLSRLAEHAARRSSSTGIVHVFTADVAVPIVAATALFAIGWFLALPPAASAGGDDEIWRQIFSVNEHPTTYAFLGAYFFSLQLLFRRFVREDLRKSAYVAVSLRIILAVIGTWAAITALKASGYYKGDEPMLSVVGFVIGVFPRTAWQFIQGAWKTLLEKIKASSILPSMQSELPVSDLDGLTVWHEARLEEEDVENIPNMASCDIVDLMLSTRVTPDRIIDWVDQSILYTHLGPPQNADNGSSGFARRDRLRQLGVYTATSLLSALTGGRRRNDPEVEKSLSTAAQANIRVFVDAMRTNSNLALICAWRGVSPTCVDEAIGPAAPASAQATIVTLQTPAAAAAAAAAAAVATTGNPSQSAGEPP